jgi:uncharacterized protein YkwD
MANLAAEFRLDHWTPERAEWNARRRQVTGRIPRPRIPARILVAFLMLPPSLAASAQPNLDRPPTAGEIQAVSREVLELVNQARAKRRRCGWKRLDAVPSLALSDALERAARAHAQDMAERRILSHAGRDGSSPGERATRSGYRWRAVAENIAGGQTTAEQVVAEWLGSPKHCANLMSPDYSELGVGYAVEPKSELKTYWAQLFAAPLSK